MDINELLNQNNILNTGEKEDLEHYFTIWFHLASNKYEINLENDNFFSQNKVILNNGTKEDIVNCIDKYLFICCVKNHSFAFFKDLKDEELDIDNIINKDSGLKENFQKQLNSWLEEKYREPNREDIKILLDYKADKMEALKISIYEKQQFKSFRNLVKEYINLLEELRKEEKWKEKIQKQLDIWLKEKIAIEQIDKEKEDINFLLEYKANKEIIYNQIKETSNFYKFKFLIEEFKEYGITLEKINKQEEKEKLKKQLNIWIKFFENIKNKRVLQKKLIKKKLLRLNKERKELKNNINPYYEELNWEIDECDAMSQRAMRDDDFCSEYFEKNMDGNIENSNNYGIRNEVVMDLVNRKIDYINTYENSLETTVKLEMTEKEILKEKKNLIYDKNNIKENEELERNIKLLQSLIQQL
ncbi:hypothetical protein [Candidatus Ruminimicrobium bovinum]|uniref:hypothetical protein n=1 Tax=Candidatus Ruminimicrobium bovinum TaxID=3242779 RepID=UPI0039B8599A